jgi:hypothetical protein
VLATAPDRLPAVLEKLSWWLANWNALTAHVGIADRSTLDRDLLEPARVLAPLLSHGHDYLHQLERECTLVQGLPLQRVAAHRDVTMWNLLAQPDGSLGVIDWEEASPSELPLIDFFYAVVDATAAASRYTDRAAAFGGCFLPNGTQRSEIARLERRVAEAAKAPTYCTDLAFHACWLRHAANEVARSEFGPFVAIVQSIGERVSQDGRLRLATS